MEKAVKMIWGFLGFLGFLGCVIQSVIRKKAIVQRSRLCMAVRAYREIHGLKNNTQKENMRQKEKKLARKVMEFFLSIFFSPLFSLLSLSLSRGESGSREGSSLLSRKFMAHKLPWPWIFFSSFFAFYILFFLSIFLFGFTRKFI